MSTSDDTSIIPTRALVRWRDEALTYLPHANVTLISLLLSSAIIDAGLLSGAHHRVQAAMLTAFILILLPVRASDVSRPLLYVHRTIMILFAAFAAVSYPVFVDEYLESDWMRLVLKEIQWIAPVAAVLGWWRPVFGLIPVVMAAWRKDGMEQLFGFTLNATDYYIVAELMIFVCVAIGIVRLADWVRGGRAPDARDGETWSLGQVAFVAAFALHLANYFYSAVAKMTLPGAGLFSWALENETHNIMMATAIIGLGPLQGHEWLAKAGLQAMAAAWPVTNWLTLGLQLAALMALFRVNWGIVMTGIYDIMHLAIFVTTGILFWKWMTLNLGLVLALRHLPIRSAPPWPVIAIGVAVLVFSPQLFRIATLGWFDAAANTTPRFEAVLEDGSSVRVPSNFFLEGATQIAKTKFSGFPDGHFEYITVFGKAKRGLDQMRASLTCDLEVGEASGLSERLQSDPRLEAYIRNHHAWIVDAAGDDGYFPYNWFPHHNWANPRVFADFAEVDLRRIVAYRYVLTSECFRHDGEGGIIRTPKLRGEHVIDVR